MYGEKNFYKELPRGRVPPPALLHEVVHVPRAPPRPRQLAEGGGGGRLVLPPALVVVHGGEVGDHGLVRQGAVGLIAGERKDLYTRGGKHFFLVLS